MPVFSDYLIRSGAGLGGLWIQLVNNTTSVAYVSDAAADANGKYTFSGAVPPPGTYTVNTSPTGGAPWTATGDANYLVPMSATDVYYDNGSAVYDASAAFYGPNVAPGGGVKLDGVTNDAAAWQAYSNWLTGKTDSTIGGRPGRVKSGISIIIGQINFSARPGWRLNGAGQMATIIRQQTDNTPIFNLGSDTDSSPHSWIIDGIGFDYTNSQPIANTNAIPLLFNGYYAGTLTNLRFNRGFYAIQTAAGAVGPWGCYWNMLYFSLGLTGGAIDFSIGTTAGLPGNRWGRFYVLANAMAGPVFKGIFGENFVWDSVEINSALLGPQWLTLASGTQLNLGAIKCEIGTYAASVFLIDIAPSCNVTIGQILARTLTVSGGATVATIVRQGSGGGGGHLFVDSIQTANSTFSGGGVGHVLQLVPTAGKPKAIIGDLTLDSTWDLLDQVTTPTAETTQVKAWNMGLFSQNKGDAAYVIVLGDPNIISFETTFTAPRTVDLPAVNNMLHNGLAYTIRAYGAINGANSLTVRCNGVTEAILGTDKVALTLTYRRNAANPQGGWVQTAYSSLP